MIRQEQEGNWGTLQAPYRVQHLSHAVRYLLGLLIQEYLVHNTLAKPCSQEGPNESLWWYPGPMPLHAQAHRCHR